jgi:hypothetical protein
MDAPVFHAAFRQIPGDGNHWETRTVAVPITATIGEAIEVANPAFSREFTSMSLTGTEIPLNDFFADYFEPGAEFCLTSLTASELRLREFGLTLEGLELWFVEVLRDDDKMECVVDLLEHLPASTRFVAFADEDVTEIRGVAMTAGLVGTDEALRDVALAREAPLVLNTQLPGDSLSYLKRVEHVAWPGAKRMVINILTDREVELLQSWDWRRCAGYSEPPPAFAVRELTVDFPDLVREVEESVPRT